MPLATIEQFSGQLQRVLGQRPVHFFDSKILSLQHSNHKHLLFETKGLFKTA